MDNKQTTSLIAVDDPAVLEKLRAVIQPPVDETALAIICVLTQRIIAYRDRCFAVQDYAAASWNSPRSRRKSGLRSECGSTSLAAWQRMFDSVKTEASQ